MLSKISVKKPMTVVAIIIIVLVLGVVSYQNTTIDMLPQMELPYVIVATIYGGASPELVEKDVTTPLEQAIAKVSGIQSSYSISQENVSLIICELAFKSDVPNVMAEINSAIDLVKLPQSDVLFDPMVLQFSINETPIMHLNVARKGYTVEESSDYLDNVINKLDGVSGVAKVSANGLINDLALINLNGGVTTESIISFFTTLAGIELQLPIEVKTEIRSDLQALLADVQDNPELITEGKPDAEKILDNLIIPYIEQRVNEDTETNEALNEIIMAELLKEIKKPASQSRKTLIKAIETILDGSYILEEGAENEAIFFKLLDNTFSEIVKGIVAYYTGSLTSMVSGELLDQVIYAQDFNMPAGNIDIGAGSYVVKVGDSISSRDGLYNMPVVSLDLSAEIKEYIGYVQSALTLVSIVSPGGKASFDSNDLTLLSEALSSMLEATSDYAKWAVDTITSSRNDSYLNMDESAKQNWANIINADAGFRSLISGYGNARPINWKTEILDYIMVNELYPQQGSLIAAETHWDEDFDAYYSARLIAEIEEVEQELPAGYEAYADYIITTATNGISDVVYVLDEADKQHWKNVMINDTNFRYCVDHMTTDKDWRKATILCVTDYVIFPRFMSGNWTSQKVYFYNTVLEARLTALDIDRPANERMYAAYVVDALRPLNPFDEYYLDGDVRSAWIDVLSANTNFITKTALISQADNWRKAILSYVYDNRASLLPTGLTLTGIKYWDANAVEVYENRIDILKTVYIPVDELSALMEQNLDSETLEILYSLFAGRSSSEIYDMFTLMLSLLERYGGEGAVATRYDEATGVTEYTVDFVVIYDTIDSLKEVLTLQMHLKDLGTISFFSDASSQITSLMERENGVLAASGSVFLRIEKEPDASTYDVIKDIKATLNGIQDSDEKFTYSITYDDSEAIDYMTKAVVSNFAIGGVLAIIVLFIFLRSIKATIGISLSIIISVLATFVLMYFSGVTLNVLSMGGLVIGIGMLVDNSIVVLENIVRLRMQGKDIYRASIQGAKQVGGAIIGSTITTIIVFLPVLFIEGLTTMFIKDLALTICFSLVASLVVAITLVPAFTSSLMQKTEYKESKLSMRLKKVYAKVLNSALNHKLISAIVVTALFGTSVLAALSLNMTMFPDITVAGMTIVCEIDNEAIDRKNEGVDINSTQYYTHEMALKHASDNMAQTFANYGDIDHVGISMTSGLQIGNLDIMQGTDIQADVVLVGEKQRKMDKIELRDSLINAINAKSNGTYKAVVGKANMYEQFTAMVSEGYKVKIFGNDIPTMRQEAEKLAEYIRALDHVTSVNTGSENKNAEYKISVNKEKANAYGLTVAEVYLQISKALEKPEIIQTIRVDEDDSKKDVGVYIYGDAYNNLSWYEAEGGSVRIYFDNNTESLGNYYMLNNDDDNIIVKCGGNISFVSPGGKIPLQKGESGFSYELASTVAAPDGTTTVVYQTKTYKPDDLTEYYSVKRTTIDLVTLPITSGDPLKTGAVSVTVPLYKLLNEESFVTNANGDITYRTAVANTERVPVGIILSDGYTAVNHEDGRKCITISVEFDDGIKEKDFTKSVNKAVAEYNNASAESKSIYIVTEQEKSMMDEIYDTLIKVLLIAMGLIYLVMLAQFQNWKHPLIIMTTIPIAFTGSFFLMFFTGTDFGILPIIGLIVLVGVVVNNGIVFVDYVNNLIRSGMPRREALIRTGVDRLRPILMTSLTTIVALSITAADKSLGNILIQPLALATVGGLAYATVVTLFFVPVMYELFNRKAKQTKKDLIMQAKDIDKIDEDDIGADKLGEDMDYYVKSLAITEKSSFNKSVSNLFYRRKAGKLAPTSGDIDAPEAVVLAENEVISEETPIAPPEPQSSDWIARLKQNINKDKKDE